MGSEGFAEKACVDRVCQRARADRGQGAVYHRLCHHSPEVAAPRWPAAVAQHLKNTPKINKHDWKFIARQEKADAIKMALTSLECGSLLRPFRGDIAPELARRKAAIIGMFALLECDDELDDDDDEEGAPDAEEHCPEAAPTSY